MSECMCCGEMSENNRNEEFRKLISDSQELKKLNAFLAGHEPSCEGCGHKFKSVEEIDNGGLCAVCNGAEDVIY